ncbi:MAG: GNAT family N-acetyltransferase [Caldilineaceae bacterium]
MTTSNELSVDHRSLRAYNRDAWNRAVAEESEWTVPVSPEQVAAARRGEWQIVLTPTKAVPRTWFPPLQGIDLLGLAAGGGQQGPLLAAAGARVTIFDNSPQQVAQDRFVAQRDGLDITTVEGDMADLSTFADGSFDLIVHPCSNLFVPAVRPVWQECYRVLRPGGLLLSGFCNPVTYIFDQALIDQDQLQVRHKLPYSDLTSLSPAERQQYITDEQPLEFSHTLEDQIGGQLEAGFVLTGFYEDRWPGRIIDEYMPTLSPPGPAKNRSTRNACMNEIPTIRTARLILRGFCAGEEDALHAIVSKPNVLRYFPRTTPWSREQVQRWMASQPTHWQEHGFGWFAVEEAASGQLMGWCGLRTLEDSGEVEVLYLYDEPFWGKGYGTEAAQRCVADGLTQYGLQEIIGLTLPGNISSDRVLEKAGLTFIGQAGYFGVTCNKYVIYPDPQPSK